MKKKLFFAAVVATALAGCSSNENLENDLANVANPVAQDGRVPIVLGLTSNDVQVLKTRGAGTVGDIDAGPGDPADPNYVLKNVYNNEDLWVLMTTVGLNSWGYTRFDDAVLGEQFNGTFKARPYGADSDLSGTPYAATEDIDGNALAYNSEWGLDYLNWNGGQQKYYPMDGTASDFFAFHIDDAATATTEKTWGTKTYDVPTIADGTAADTKVVAFQIDGTQDILAGKASNGLPISDEDGARTGFTAKTARGGLVPSIPMKHLLTRLTFELLPGHQDAKGVIVDKLVVYSKSKGTLTVAYNQDGTIADDQLIAWDETETDPVEFELMNKPALPYDAVNDKKSDLVPVVTPFDKTDATTYLAMVKSNVKDSYGADPADPSDDTDGIAYVADEANITADDPQNPTSYEFTPARMGDAMFVQPGQTEFQAIAYMKFPVEGYTYDPNETPEDPSDDEAYEYLTVPYRFLIRVKDAQGAVVENGLLLGHSYNVQLKVYGLSKVEIRTTLTAWDDGGDIVIDTDDPTNTWEEAAPAPAPAPEP